VVAEKIKSEKNILILVRQTDRHTDYLNAVVAFASAGIFRWDLLGFGWQAGLGQAY
jgi:hypothetical protein